MQTIEVEGLGALHADLSKMRDKLTRKDLLKIIRPGAQRLRKAILQRAPMRSGGIRSSLRVRAGRGKNDEPYANIYVDYAEKAKSPRDGKMVKPYWAIMVHNGTLDRKTGAQKIKPNPFIFEAFESTREEAAATILQNIKRHI